MPPPGGIAGGVFGSGFSATIASVVINRPATEAASCSACRTTLVGSMMPGPDHVGELALLGIVAVVRIRAVEQLADDDRAVGARVLGDLPGRVRQRLLDDVDADPLVVVRRLQIFEGADA